MLKILFTDQRREPVWMVDKSLTIGGAEDNDLVLEDPQIELQHARIVFANDSYGLHDLGSEAGSYVNGIRITQKALQNGDKVQLGSVQLEIIDPSLPENQPEWCLVACSSWLSGQEFPVRSRSQSNQIKIGRASHCDMIFAGTHLSREHALLTVWEDRLEVKDLKSANGTFINDKRISEGALYSGDLLRLDVYGFRVFGPGRRQETSEPAKIRTTSVGKEAVDGRETLIRPALNIPIPEQPKPKAQPTTPKRWKTAPTSPGNRQEEPQEKQGFSLFAKVVAIGLTLAVLGLIAYLFSQ